MVHVVVALVYGSRGCCETYKPGIYLTSIHYWGMCGMNVAARNCGGYALVVCEPLPWQHSQQGLKASPYVASKMCRLF